jgi:hypothetical protein
MTANFEAPDRMLKAEAKLPIEPIEKAEPTDPIDRNDPYDPIDMNELREYALSTDCADFTERSDDPSAAGKLSMHEVSRSFTIMTRGSRSAAHVSRGPGGSTPFP